MSYQKIKDDLGDHPLEPMSEAKEGEMGDSSETDVDPDRSDSDSSSFLGLKLGNLGVNPESRLKSVKKVRADILLLISFGINLLLIVLVGALCWRMAASKEAPHHHHHSVDELVYTPAEDILALRVENYYTGLPYGPAFPTSKYQGWPDEEKDRLWAKYWDGNHMRVNKTIAEKLPHLSLHVPVEGHQDEYIMGIMAFHHMHCLSALRKYIYPKRYNTSIVDAHGNVDFEKWHHLDHCVEILRQSIECRPDTTARTFYWHAGAKVVPHEWVTHTCRNFDALQGWAEEATISITERTHLVDGKIVVDDGKPLPPEAESLENTPPDDWAYTVDDL